jgi:hypothetical protein
MTAQTTKGPWWNVSEWEFREAVKRTRAAQKLPRGERGAVKRSIAADYGVCVKTLERWLSYDVRSVKLAGFVALFVISGRRPSQVTPWEKAA